MLREVIRVYFQAAKKALADLHLERDKTIIAIVGATAHPDYYAGIIAKKRSCRLHQLPPRADVSSVVSLLERAQIAPLT